MRAIFGLLTLGVSLTVAAWQAAPRRPFGFTPSGATTHADLERRFQAMPSTTRIRSAHAYLADKPHLAGSPRDRELAEWTRDQFTAYGLEDVEITTHEVLLPWPEEITVEMVAPRPWRAAMREDPIDGDPYTQISPEQAGHPLSRVLGVRRDHGPRRVRRQRQPGRLRSSGVAGHRRQGQDRARSLFGAVQLPRLQGADGAAARRRRHPDLLGSCRRWLPQGQGVSGWPLGTGQPHPARRDRLRLHGAGRSADAGLGVGTGRAPDREVAGDLASQRSSARRSPTKTRA